MVGIHYAVIIHNKTVQSIKIMNSKERHELRYQRRKSKRLEKEEQFNESYCDFDRVFTFDNLYASYKKCCKGVGWKASVQKYKANALLNINNAYKNLHAGKFKSKGFYEFDIVERGKPRHIRSVDISERVVQRCLCDYCLVPAVKRTFIYDNGACIKHRGIDFALNRLNRHLEKFYREYGNDGYVLTFDFAKYFDNINHDIVMDILRKKIKDERLMSLIEMLVENFGDKGFGLGSQISQSCALALPDELDHFIKEVLGIKYYFRYMDDGCIIHRDKEYLRYCLEEIRKICDKLGIVINEKKTQIIKLRRGFKFLKTIYILTDAGQVIRKPCKKNITQMRRKLKTFKRWVDEGKMSKDDVRTSWYSWRGHQLKFNSYWARKRMGDLYNKLFNDDELSSSPF